MMLTNLFVLVCVFCCFDDVNCQHLESQMVATIIRSAAKWQHSWQMFRSVFDAIAESVRQLPGRTIEAGSTNSFFREALSEQRTIYTSASEDIEVLGNLMHQYNWDKGHNNTCSLLITKLRQALNRMDELVDKLKPMLHSSRHKRISVLYTYQNGVVYNHHTSSQLQVHFIKAMNKAKLATNDLLNKVHELKVIVYVDSH
ncbi:hypothetical protein FGIG_02647 [Fasciola gigantica]|uniref:Uncharacterized protein n=1 Tax=Fasciola gigantica TaxID=46835 RepID=A0A504YCC3_FASGI|nr:hypothetical protein FGIG_02647 [Fasciola gigantica]